jgi:uncharacterized membrane protein
MSDSPMQTLPPQGAVAPGADVVREQDKIMLLLSYLWILALIPLLTVKDSDYVQFHAKQGLALAIVWFGWCLVGAVLGFLPIVGWLLSCMGHLALLVVTVMAIVKAFAPCRWKIPVVYPSPRSSSSASLASTWRRAVAGSPLRLSGALGAGRQEQAWSCATRNGPSVCRSIWW